MNLIDELFLVVFHNGSDYVATLLYTKNDFMLLIIVLMATSGSKPILKGLVFLELGWVTLCGERAQETASYAQIGEIGYIH